MTLGERVRALREQHNWTQTQLSRVSGVLQSAISAIENDKTRRPETETLERLARALGVQREDLLGELAPAGVTPDEKEELCHLFDSLVPAAQIELLALARLLSAMPRSQG